MLMCVAECDLIKEPICKSKTANELRVVFVRNKMLINPIITRQSVIESSFDESVKIITLKVEQLYNSNRKVSNISFYRGPLLG